MADTHKLAPPTRNAKCGFHHEWGRCLNTIYKIIMMDRITLGR